jgi:hypothetical protein
VVACYGATGLGLARYLRVTRAIPARSIIAAIALAAPMPASAHWKLSTRDTTTAATVGDGAGPNPRTPTLSSGLDSAVADVGLAADVEPTPRVPPRSSTRTGAAIAVSAPARGPAARSSGRTLTVARSGGDTPQLSACATGTANAAPATTSQPNRIVLRPLVIRRPTDARSKRAMFLLSLVPRHGRQRRFVSAHAQHPMPESERDPPYLDGFAAGRALHPQ